MLRYLFLVILLSCASAPEKPKDDLTKQDQEELIQSYLNFYSYSLKEECPGVTFDNSISQHLDSRSFDLSQENTEGHYVYLGKDLKEFTRGTNVEERKPLKMLLLKERRVTQSYYRLCADKSNEPINCTDDILMNKIVKTKSLQEICEILSSRKLPLPPREAASDIVTVMKKLHIEKTKAP